MASPIRTAADTTVSTSWCTTAAALSRGTTQVADLRKALCPAALTAYSRAIALDQGIGAALHVHAPGLGGEHVAAAEHDAPPLLVTADDLADINPVDSKLVNAASLAATFARLPPVAGLAQNWSRE